MILLLQLNESCPIWWRRLWTRLFCPLSPEKKKNLWLLNCQSKCLNLGLWISGWYKLVDKCFWHINDASYMVEDTIVTSEGLHIDGSIWLKRGQETWDSKRIHAYRHRSKYLRKNLVLTGSNKEILISKVGHLIRKCMALEIPLNPCPVSSITCHKQDFWAKGNLRTHFSPLPDSHWKIK